MHNTNQNQQELPKQLLVANKSLRCHCSCYHIRTRTPRIVFISGEEEHRQGLKHLQASGCPTSWSNCSNTCLVGSKAHHDFLQPFSAGQCGKNTKDCESCGGVPMFLFIFSQQRVDWLPLVTQPATLPQEAFPGLPSANIWNDATYALHNKHAKLINDNYS